MHLAAAEVVDRGERRHTRPGDHDVTDVQQGGLGEIHRLPPALRDREPSDRDLAVAFGQSRQQPIATGRDDDDFRLDVALSRSLFEDLLEFAQ